MADHAALVRLIGETIDPKSRYPLRLFLSDGRGEAFADRIIAAVAERVAAMPITDAEVDAALCSQAHKPGYSLRGLLEKADASYVDMEFVARAALEAAAKCRAKGEAP